MTNIIKGANGQKTTPMYISPFKKNSSFTGILSMSKKTQPTQLEPPACTTRLKAGSIMTYRLLLT